MANGFSLNEIMATVSRLYFAKPQFYQVWIQGGGKVPDAGQDMMFYCSEINIPGVTFDTDGHNRHRTDIARHYPTKKHVGDLTMKFYEAEYLGARQYFINWLTAIQRDTDSRVGYYDDYIKVIVIRCFDKTGKIKTYEATLSDAFPTEIGELSRGYSKVNTIPTFDVGFKFHNITESYTQTSAAFSVNPTLNASPLLQTSPTTIASLTNLVSG